jgi:phenylalanyl-tRNA synthetase beta chain
MRHLQLHRSASAALFGGGRGRHDAGKPDLVRDEPYAPRSLLPGLLQAAARNQARGFMDLALFEVGPAFHGGEPGEQHLLVTGLLVGRTGPKDVHGARRAVDVFDAKADAEAVLSALGAPAKCRSCAAAPGWWHPGRHGMICLGPKKVCWRLRRVAPQGAAEMDVKGPAMAFASSRGDPQPRRTGATRAALAQHRFAGGRARFRLCRR